jgi:hypothetical protein
MNHNLQVKSKNLALGLAFLGLTGLLALLYALAAFQLHALIVYLGILIVESPSLRPVGWNSSTIVGVNKCGIVILGMLWLGLVLFSHHYLKEALADHQLWSKAGRLVLMSLGLYIFSAVVLYILG